MIETSTLQFLTALKANNSKEWLDANRPAFVLAKANMENLATALLAAISKFDPSISHLQAKDCMFRINRDVRFSKNKAPYKTNMALYISRNGKKGLGTAGYYLHVEPGAAFLAGGIYMPPAPQLKKIRQEIDYNLEAFLKLLKKAGMQAHFGGLHEQEGSKLLRPPKGYDETNPAIEYLKLKSFIATTPLSAEALTSKDAVKQMAEKCKVLFPLIDFLNGALAEE